MNPDYQNLAEHNQVLGRYDILIYLPTWCYFKRTNFYRM